MKLLPNSSVTSDTFPLLRRMWDDHLRARWRTIASISFWMAVFAGTTAAYPLAVNFAFDAFSERQPSALYLVPAAVFALTLAKAASMFIQAALANRLTTDLEYDLRTSIYASLVDADVGAVKSAAGQTGRFLADVGFVLNAFDRIVKTAARDLITMTALLGAMLWLDWQLTLVTLVIAPFAIWPIVAIGRRLRLLSTQTQERIGEMTGSVHESLASKQLVASFTLEPWLKARAGGLFGAVRDLRRRALNLKAGVQPMMEAIGGISITIIFGFAGWRIISGQQSVGEFTGYLTAVILIAQPLNAIGTLNAVVQEGLAAAARIFALIDQEPQICDRPGATDLPSGPGRISFSGVSFAYGRGNPTLRDIDLTVEPKSHVALVGPSGAGKSTLFSLLPRFYDPAAGMIEIDNCDISTVTLRSLRHSIAYVAQDVFLFDDTIKTNIEIGAPGASDAEIIEAAKAADADGFISALADGYDTHVGDRGMLLSGGERQRVALARAILKDAPILLLDEATSSLDVESEDQIQNALSRLMQERTTLVIAHRLSTVVGADLIVVMDKGRIVATGTHEELLADCPLYARLNRHRFQDDEDDIATADSRLAMSKAEV